MVREQFPGVLTPLASAVVLLLDVFSPACANQAIKSPEGLRQPTAPF